MSLYIGTGTLRSMQSSLLLCYEMLSGIQGTLSVNLRREIIDVISVLHEADA